MPGTDCGNQAQTLKPAGIIIESATHEVTAVSTASEVVIEGKITTPLLEVRELSVEFATDLGTVHAVDRVGFSLKRGETLAVVGESGAGKSVTMLALMGLVPAPGRVVGGSIRLDGRELVGAGEPEAMAVRGREIGMIFQDPQSALNPVLAVQSQVAEAIRMHQPVSRRQARASADELLELVGMPHRLLASKRYPHELSGGMCQRAMIAMAIANHPSVLIADEATTALDVTIQAQILDLLRELANSMSVGLLLVTHDLGIVAENADRVLVMYAGRVVEYGAVNQIFSNPLHPYTAGLLASVPSTQRGSERLHAIRGQPPSLIQIPRGCAFHPRCPCVEDVCRKTAPLLTGSGDSSHLCSCHFAEDHADNAPPAEPKHWNTRS